MVPSLGYGERVVVDGEVRPHIGDRMEGGCSKKVIA